MTTTWRINHPTLTMRIAKLCSDLLHTPAPPPPGGFVNSLPEAFGARNADGEVFVIGYQGEWFHKLKPTLRTRVHNWFVGIYNHQLDDYDDSSPHGYPDDSEIDEATLREGYWHI